MTETNREMIIAAPPSPCLIKHCNSQHSCTGCPDYHVWYDTYAKALRAQDLLTVHERYQKYLAKKQQLADAQREIKRMRAQLVSLGFEPPEQETNFFI